MPFIGPFYIEPKAPTVYARRKPVVDSPGHGTSRLKGCLTTMFKPSPDIVLKRVQFFDDQHKMWRERGMRQVV